MVPDEKDSAHPSAQALAYLRRLAAKGGKARAAKLTRERRQEIARQAIAARWAKREGPKP